ncbi:MAG: hypothetical protein C4336_05110 [Armatimonadota bacterium]
MSLFVHPWWLGLLLIGLLNLAGVWVWHYDEGITHPDNFENLDTRMIVARLEKLHAVWQWFTGDWVLGNGFYRPLPSLLYKLDYALWGRHFLAYKWTNGVLAIFCGWLAVWLAWELSRQRWVALGVGVVFSLWQTGFLGGVPIWVGWVALILGGLWGWRVGSWRKGVLIGSLGAVGLWELSFIPSLPDLHLASFAYRAVGWIPGRTATLMALFALIALSAYCRYCTTGHKGWAIVSLLGFLGALGSHEGAVVLPLLMALCGWGMLKHGGRFQVWVLGIAVGVLLAYLLFYGAVIPTDTEYHRQRLKRFRNIGNTWLGWLFPPFSQVSLQFQLVWDVPLAVFLPTFLGSMLWGFVYLLGLGWALRRERMAIVGWLGSLGAYLPLSPVIPLMHYYYLPAVFRALWVLALLMLLVRSSQCFAQAGIACSAEPCEQSGPT